MRMLLLLGFGTLITGCGYISDAKMKGYRDVDGDDHLWPDDCDDNDPTLTVPQKWYPDEDGDGFGVEDNFEEACFAPEGTVTTVGDCDDTDASVYPNADDAPYDGIDSNCDGANDCDVDGDGYDGSAEGGAPTEGCPDASDCDDSDPNIYPDPSVSEVFFNGIDDDCDPTTADGDADGDGYWHKDYEAIATERGFDPLDIPSGQDGDCFDVLDIPVEGFEAQPLNGFDPLLPEEVSPDATERFYDGIDQNCDESDDFDQDSDGVSSSEWQNRNGETGEDCVDSVDSANYQDFGIDPVDIYPNAVDVWYDGVDQNCDDANDFDQDLDGFNINFLDCDGDGIPAESTCDFDGDGTDDFFGGGDCNDSDNSVSLDAEEGVADGIDQNCDGLELCYEDFDQDGSGSDVEEYSSDLTCTALGFSASADDCDDNNGSSYPGATEIVADGIDQDCDNGDLCYADSDLDGLGASSTTNSSDLDCDDSGEADNTDDCNDGDNSIGILLWYPDIDQDSFGDMSAAAVEDCSQPANHVADNTDCDDSGTGATIFPGAVEICDGLDLSCNGSIPADEVDDDGDGYVECIFDSIAWAGDSLVVGGEDCDDNDLNSYPGATELCDGIDNACLGSVSSDEEDGDGDGFVECSGWEGEVSLTSGDCNDSEGTIYPGAPETPVSEDENCDGLEALEGVENCVSVESSGRYFLICDDPMSWDEANNVCLVGGYAGLASIDSGTQNLDISNAADSTFGPQTLWHGYNDQESEGFFAWSNGSGSSYEYWDTNIAQPDGGTVEGCVHMGSNMDAEGYLWQDLDCLATLGFVCSDDSATTQ